MPHPYYRQKVIKVRCSTCEEWIDERKVEFIDISEGMMGEDRLTFKCPKCKKESTSSRVG